LASNVFSAAGPYAVPTTFSRAASGSESKTSACDSSGTCAQEGLTAGQCKTKGDVVGYCTTTTPPNGTIPTGTSCPTSAAPDDCTGYCATSCAAFEYCLTAPDANCANAPQDCEARCTSCVQYAYTRRRRRRSSSLNASSVNASSSLNASSVNASSSLNASDDCTGYCATSCAAFEYCLTAPDANCANAPQDCETRCASCVQGCSYADVIKSCEEQRGAYAWTCSRIQVQSKVCASCEREVENLESELQRLRALLGSS